MAAVAGEIVTTQDMYEVEKLIALKEVDGKVLYQVRWKGYTAQSDTMEPRENLIGCEDMIKDLHSKVEKRKSRLEKKRAKRISKFHQPKDKKEIKVFSRVKRDAELVGEELTKEQTGSSSRDTYWRDFDEGRINPVSGQDMYSKVKERAARTISQSDPTKATSDIHHKQATQLCPKVILKRRTSCKNRPGCLAYKSSLAMESVSMPSLNTNKNHVSARDNLKKSGRNIKKYKADENKQICSVKKEHALDIGKFHSAKKTRKSLVSCKTSFESGINDNQNVSDCSKVLQELPVNDETCGSDFLEFSLPLLNAKSNMVIGEQQTTQSPKDKETCSTLHTVSSSDAAKTDFTRDHNLTCKVTIPDISKASDYYLPSSCKMSLPSKVLKPGIASGVKLPLPTSRIKKVLCDFTSDLWTAVRQKDSNSLDLLLKYNKNWNFEEKDGRGLTLLMAAVTSGCVEIIEKLCHNGASVNSSQTDGTTALMIASQMGSHVIVRILLKLNAHKDLQNRKGETALMLACQHCKAKVVELLLEYGANFALTNRVGVNALRISNQYANMTEIPKILTLHISRMKLVFEPRAMELVKDIAAIKYALFPIQSFSLNEGPKFCVTFQHHVKLESPGRGYLLFIANTTIDISCITCLFNGVSPVLSVTVNGKKQESFKKAENFVFKMSCFITGNNELLITTAHHPQSQVKLVVCAYRVHYTVNPAAQSNNLENLLSSSDPLSE